MKKFRKLESGFLHRKQRNCVVLSPGAGGQNVRLLNLVDAFITQSMRSINLCLIQPARTIYWTV